MQNQNQVIDALMKPEAYDEIPGHIELIQTHISFIFLTKNFAYKVKKPVNFGFLDFTSLERRRLFCEKELELNKRLCGDMYIEVAPINKSDAIRIKGKGKTVEYALKMKRISQEKIMSRLLKENKVDKKLIGEIARIITEFHSTAETNDKINEFGSLKIIKTNWKENFEQTKNVIGKTITQESYDNIKKKIFNFLGKNKSTFEQRIIQGKIKDCHGDIHSGNIFVADRIYIFDAIEFNERFRYSDVASDAAFLAMDLDFRGRKDLSDFFIETYIESSRDEDLKKIMPFYKCYRAYVRGKVAGFKLNDPNICDKEKNEAVKEARSYFLLASKYAENI